MGYPREDSIQRATEVFWLKGYLGTGMRDLQSALDKRPGSIYAAFGSKEGLYLEALNHYTAMLRADIASVARSNTPLAALKAFLRAPLTVEDSAHHKIQCLIVKTQADWTELPDRVKAALQESLASLRGEFQSVIKSAQDSGELAATVPVAQAAMWLQGQFIAMRTLATSVGKPLDLAWMVDKIVADLAANWPHQVSSAGG